MRPDNKRNRVVRLLYLAAACLFPALLHAAEVAAPVNPRVLFIENCASCHRLDGHGSPGAVPDLHEYLGQFAEHPQ